MTETSHQPRLLHCCTSLPKQHATGVIQHATTKEQTTQRVGLKALALQVLSRNTTRNTHATDGEKSCNNDMFPEDRLSLEITRSKLRRLAKVAGLVPALVSALDDNEVDACRGLSETALITYVRMLRHADLRAHGRVPADETTRALCRYCGPV